METGRLGGGGGGDDGPPLWILAIYCATGTKIGMQIGLDEICKVPRALLLLPEDFNGGGGGGGPYGWKFVVLSLSYGSSLEGVQEKILIFVNHLRQTPLVDNIRFSPMR